MARRAPDSDASSECGIDCFVITDIAQGLGEISSIAVAGDGSVFAVEEGRRVLRLRDGVAIAVFEAEAGTTLRDVALDPAFSATGRVFVSLLRRRDSSTGELEVLRLRHLAGTLGEPSTIVAGVYVSSPRGAAGCRGRWADLRGAPGLLGAASVFGGRPCVRPGWRRAGRPTIARRGARPGRTSRHGLGCPEPGRLAGGPRRASERAGVVGIPFRADRCGRVEYRGGR
jgi:hypothetical protein